MRGLKENYDIIIKEEWKLWEGWRKNITSLLKRSGKAMRGLKEDYNIIIKEEWESMRGLEEDYNIIIIPFDNGSCVVV